VGGALRRARAAQALFWLVLAGTVVALGAAYMISRAPHIARIGEKVSRTAPEMPEQQVAQDNVVGGLDAANLPFKIKTLKGYQDKTDANLYHLQTVAGTFRRDNGKDLDVSGNQGTYQSVDKLLHLEGEVVVAEAPRFTAHMSKAVFDLKAKQLSSDAPVHVTLDNGTIQADSLLSENNGERLFFKGGVKAHFDAPQPAQANEVPKQ
jgi:LPS export ABC transporter protein LptC